MRSIIVTGIGTGVGKTISAAIITKAVEGDYWKPVQSGSEEERDDITVRDLLPLAHEVHTPAYTLQAPLSPHHAARLENKVIDPGLIVKPKTLRPLIIETAGGPFAPLTNSLPSIDLFSQWHAEWVVVSKHYLGSINHTLLTIETLKARNLPVIGVIFNGQPNPDSEEAILHIAGVPCIGRLLPEPNFTPLTIQRYAKQWQQQLSHIKN